MLITKYTNKETPVPEVFFISFNNFLAYRHHRCRFRPP